MLMLRLILQGRSARLSAATCDGKLDVTLHASQFFNMRMCHESHKLEIINPTNQLLKERMFITTMMSRTRQSFAQGDRLNWVSRVAYE